MMKFSGQKKLRYSIIKGYRVFLSFQIEKFLIYNFILEKKDLNIKRIFIKIK